MGTVLEDVINAGIEKALKDLHTCLPGVVQVFDPDTQTADIQPTIQRKMSGEVINLPLLTGVPVRFPATASFCITLPIAKGDFVLLVFAERSIDNWLENGGIQPAQDSRTHSLSDAFALPLMYPDKEPITDFNSSALEIKSRTGAAKITMSDSNIELEGTVVINGVDYEAHAHEPGSFTGYSGTPITGVSGGVA